MGKEYSRNPSPGHPEIMTYIHTDTMYMPNNQTPHLWFVYHLISGTVFPKRVLTKKALLYILQSVLYTYLRTCTCTCKMTLSANYSMCDIKTIRVSHVCRILCCTLYIECVSHNMLLCTHVHVLVFVTHVVSHVTFCFTLCTCFVCVT